MAASRLIAPVEMDSTRTRGASGPIFMMDPFPQLFSICAIARLNAFLRSSWMLGTAMKGSSSEREIYGPNKLRRVLQKINARDPRPRSVGLWDTDEVASTFR